MNGHLDGNFLAGPLSDVFRLEATAAMGRCVACGDTRPLGASIVYSSAMGSVGRCVACDDVLLTHVQTPTGTFLNTRGLSWIRFDIATGSATVDPRITGSESVDPQAGP